MTNEDRGTQDYAATANGLKVRDVDRTRSDRKRTLPRASARRSS